MTGPIHEPLVNAGRMAWLGPVTCLAVVVGHVAFFSTTTVYLDFRFAGADSASFAFNFASDMDWWYHITLVVWFAAWSTASLVLLRRTERFRALVWAGAILNGLSAVVLAIFLALAISQMASAT